MNQKRVAVLGGGMVGAAIVADLAADSAQSVPMGPQAAPNPGALRALSVTVMDKRPEALASLRERYGVATVEVDLTEPDAIREAIEPFDLVMGALPGALGLGALGAVIDEGKRYCDVSFMPED